MARVGTVDAVDFYDSLGRNKSKDFVAVNGIAAFREPIVYSFDVVAYDENVI